MGSCGYLKMFSFFIKPSAAWNNSLCTFNSWDKCIFPLRLVLLCSFRHVPATCWSVHSQLTPRDQWSRKLLPYRCPFVPCVLSRKRELWPVLTNPGSLSSSSRLVQSETRLSHWQSQQYSQIHSRSLCHFMSLIKSLQIHINYLTHPKPYILLSFSVAWVKNLHFVLTTWFCYCGFGPGKLNINRESLSLLAQNWD